ncbi:hypothetical protein COV20_01470 [Candidatus Woesearchaeota archaeon CG10_big_fil_rev_8_21_14_0_10_45_16]|nr:MAG: hypothetical protein COV20_01470 [Candidatus Woesearchaeota archaeon CG10_big_fil_rev_8_21_14_0_10_45_16]
MKFKWIILLSLIIIIISILTLKEKPDECILLGSAFYPGALISSDANSYVNGYDENLILLHFGDSVPWEILRKCEDIDNCILSGDDAAAYDGFKTLVENLALHTRASQKKVYLAVSPINNDRNGVATNWETERNLGYVPPGNNFNDQQIRTLYKRWVRYLVSKFKPDYLSQAIEFNMYADKEDFDSLLSLLKEIKEENKDTTIVIGPTTQWEFYKKNPQKIEWDSLGEGFAFSTYPHLFDPASTEQVSINHYNFEDFMIPIDDKILFISETGIQPDFQDSLLTTLFRLKERYDLQAVVWFFKEDANLYFNKLPDEYPFTIFQNNGLYTDTGERKPGATLWEKELACA